MKFSKQLGFGITLLLLASGFAFAQNIPLNNWTVPPYAQSSHSGGITTMTDVTSPRSFIGVQPCRVADTRGNGAPIQGGIFPNSGLRTWDVTGICGIPAGADAISVNFTVVAAGGIPAGSFLLSWPTGQAPPPTAIMTYGPGQILSNAAIIPLGPGEQIQVNVSGSTHVIMDVNGYFSDTLQDPTHFLELYNNSTGYTIRIDNASTSCNGACGLRATTSSGWAVSGFSPGDVGVRGDSNTYNGVWGQSSTHDAIAGFGGRDGAYLQGARHGAIGASVNATDAVYGVIGSGISTNAFSAGVSGQVNHAAANAARFINSGLSDADVYIATQSGGVNYGVLAPNLRLHAGSLVITGATKNFAAPHPEDPSKEIKYASVEAPTVDVYFRGTAELVNGIARITIPDHFRFTARDGTYMTTLTPVGRSVTLSVDQEGPDGIVVRGSGNARFHYVVFAERAEIEGFEPVQRNESFTPDMLERGGGPQHLPASTRALLVRNGTLNPDGTYNLETAHAQGWTIPERPTVAPAPVPNP
jgi:hypothetical protein